MHPFRQAVEARDIEAVAALLADDVVLNSPVAFQPYAGKPIARAILEEVIAVLSDLRYLREIGHDDDDVHALVFEATVDGKYLNGCDFIHVNDDGLIDELTVMMRPLSAATAFAAEMSVRFESVQARVAAVIGKQS